MSYDSDAEYADSDEELLLALAEDVDSADEALRCLKTNSTISREADNFQVIVVRRGSHLLWKFILSDMVCSLLVTPTFIKVHASYHCHRVFVGCCLTLVLVGDNILLSYMRASKLENCFLNPTCVLLTHTHTHTHTYIM